MGAVLKGGVLGGVLRHRDTASLCPSLYPLQHHRQGGEGAAAPDQLPRSQHALPEGQAAGEPMAVLACPLPTPLAVTLVLKLHVQNMP